MFGLGASELFLIFLVVFLLFGARNIPEIARSMGRAIHQFKKGAHDAEKEINAAGDGIAKSITGEGSSVQKGDSHAEKKTVG